MPPSTPTAHTLQLRKTILNEEFDYTLLSSALSHYAGVRQKIHQLLRAGLITRVKKGLYVFGGALSRKPICKEVLANLIYGPSCISLEYALAFHGFIPERVEVVTSVTPKRDKKFETPVGVFTYRYLVQERYALGIEHVVIDATHSTFMASPEKALCDYVLLNKIPTFYDHKAAADFLEHDLRIDREQWGRFRLNTLQTLNSTYGNHNVELIITALREAP